jgi:uncharacterized protein Yka (UPF0111/DUF47 family)
MGRVKELIVEDWDEVPADAYGPGFYVHSLDNAVRDLDQFSINELANEISDLEDLVDRLQRRIEKIKERETDHAATLRNR